MSALRRAWVWYAVLMITPLALLMLQAWFWMADLAPAIGHSTSNILFICTMFWIGITGPLGFLGQEYFFRTYYHGQPVTPQQYLRGKVIVWSLLISGALVSTVLIFLSQNYFPHLFAVIVVYGFMFTQYPHGRAMFNTNGDKDSAELYAEPK